MVVQEKQNILSALQTQQTAIPASSAAKVQETPEVTSGAIVDNIPQEDIHNGDAYTLELSERGIALANSKFMAEKEAAAATGQDITPVMQKMPEPKEPVDYTEKKLPRADGSPSNEPPPVIKVRVPINEMIVVSVKSKKQAPVEPDPVKTRSEVKREELVAEQAQQDVARKMENEISNQEAEIKAEQRAVDIEAISERMSPTQEASPLLDAAGTSAAV